MRKITDYIIVAGTFHENLSIRVHDMIVFEGWEPIGGASVSDRGGYCQAMVKYAPDAPEPHSPSPKDITPLSAVVESQSAIAVAIVSNRPAKRTTALLSRKITKQEFDEV